MQQSSTTMKAKFGTLKVTTK